MTHLRPEIECSGLSHTGPVREDNQDAIRLPNGCPAAERGWLYAVADGMGGYSHGQMASVLALEKLFQVFYGQRTAPLKTLRQGVQAANLSIYKTAQRLGVGRMGTTLTGASIIGNRLYLVHVGDSRAYLVRDRRATCLTDDHTTVGELVRLKVLSPDKVRTHAQRSILTKSIGLALFVQPDVSEHTLREGDCIILCSDGVWSVIEDHEFADLAGASHSAHALSQSLIDLSLERQTDDNASAIAIHIQRLSPSPAGNEGRRVPGWGFWRSLLPQRNAIAVEHP
jgi:protein phosphatase